MSPTLTIRVMTESDVAFGMALKSAAGWNQVESDWVRFLRCEPEGCFVAEWEGEAAGTATALTYGDRFGWVGMVLVREDFRRRGIGRALLQRAIAHVEARCATVKLDATAEGKRLYDTMGFGDEYPVERWYGLARRREDTGVRQLAGGGGEWAGEGLEAQAFGADRSVWVRALMRDGRAFALPARRSEGYAVLHPGTKAWHLGPVVAADPDLAERLIAAALSGIEGEPLFLDVVTANPSAVAVAEACGLARQREWVRMARGPNDHPGRPALVYGTSGPETG